MALAPQHLALTPARQETTDLKHAHSNRSPAFHHRRHERQLRNQRHRYLSLKALHSGPGWALGVGRGGALGSRMQPQQTHKVVLSPASRPRRRM